MAGYGHLHRHGRYWNTQANYNFDVYAMMTNSVPSQTHAHFMNPYNGWIPTHAHLNPYNDWHIRNMPANYMSDAYNRPPPPRMIDDNLVIDASTISPHIIHDQQQMMNDIGPSIIDDLDRNREGTLSEEAISNNMKTRAATQEDAGEICTVCQDDLQEEGNEEFIATLHCGHGYHASCIKRWLRQKNVCPLCNAVAIVVPEDT